MATFYNQHSTLQRQIMSIQQLHHFDNTDKHWPGYFYKPHWWEGSAISRVHPLLVYTEWVMAVVHQGLKVRIMVRVSKV